MQTHQLDGFVPLTISTNCFNKHILSTLKSNCTLHSSDRPVLLALMRETFPMFMCSGHGRTMGNLVGTDFAARVMQSALTSR